MASSSKVQPISFNCLVEPLTHFFKVILSASLADKKLGIPERFAKKFGNELSAVAKLIVPDGRVWQIGLTRDGSKIWFQDGWHEFVQYHSISAGHFLVFKYVKNSTFDVVIFDMSACEIPYPYNGVPGYDEQNSKNLEEMEHKSVSSFVHSDSEDSFEPQSKKGKMEFSSALEENGIIITEKHRLLSIEEKHRAINIAKLFKPKNPSFMVVLLSRNINRNQPVTLPAKFAKKYISRNAKVVTLQASDGREWSVRITWSSDSACRFTRGLINGFSQDQNLKKGDVCVFELVRTKDITLKVSIFHAGKRLT